MMVEISNTHILVDEVGGFVLKKFVPSTFTTLAFSRESDFKY